MSGSTISMTGLRGGELFGDGDAALVRGLAGEALNRGRFLASAAFASVKEFLRGVKGGEGSPAVGDAARSMVKKSRRRSAL